MLTSHEIATNMCMCQIKTHLYEVYSNASAEVCLFTSTARRTE